MYNPYQFQYQQMQQPIQQQIQQPQQMQSIMIMPSEQDALRYAVAPGNSIMFKIENQPLIIEKSMGLSQLDSPVITYIDLVPRDTGNKPEYATKEDLEQLREEIKGWQDNLTEKRTTRKKVGAICPHFRVHFRVHFLW